MPPRCPSGAVRRLFFVRSVRRGKDDGISAFLYYGGGVPPVKRRRFGYSSGCAGSELCLCAASWDADFGETA